VLSLETQQLLPCSSTTCQQTLSLKLHHTNQLMKVEHLLADITFIQLSQALN